VLVWAIWLFCNVKESVLTQANVKAIYGEPISAHEKRSFQLQKLCTARVQVQALEASAKRTLEVKGAVVVAEYGLFLWAL
jgi:hypothetical protein